MPYSAKPLPKPTSALRAQFERRTRRTDGCWLWTGSHDLEGYGRFKFGRRYVRAHRMALALAGRTPGAGDLVCHRCDNPPCVNPAHLFLGSHRDNFLDCASKGRNTLVAFGEAHGLAKLTVDLVREIRRSTVGSTQLARTLGLSRSAVHRARHGLTWGHVQ